MFALGIEAGEWCGGTSCMELEPAWPLQEAAQKVLGLLPVWHFSSHLLGTSTGEKRNLLVQCSEKAGPTFAPAAFA